MTIDDSLIRKIKVFAIFSRFLICFLLILLCWLPIFPADVFNPPIPDHISGLKKLDRWLLWFLNGFAKWDSIYFHFISEHGYCYANSLAFFPLFPLCVRLITVTLFLPLQFVLHQKTILLLAGICLNNYCFVNSAVLLFKLGKIVLTKKNDMFTVSDLKTSKKLDIADTDTSKDCIFHGYNETKSTFMSYQAALIFCLNPASIFFSVFYSESLYLYLCLNALLYLEQISMTKVMSLTSIFSNPMVLKAAIYFGLALLCRSNGLLNVIYVVFFIIRLFIYIFHNFDNRITFSIIASTWCRTLSLFLILIIPMVSLFIIYQLYSHILFCTLLVDLRVPFYLVSYGNMRGYIVQKLNVSKASFCFANTIPRVSNNINDNFDYSFLFTFLNNLPYQKIQSGHWDVGFLRYYSLTQIPNFLLVFPIILICCYGIYRVVKEFNDCGDFHRYFHWQCISRLARSHFMPYVLHIVVLFCSTLPFIHVQVITRMTCSSCVAFYWLISYLIMPSSKEATAVTNCGVKPGSKILHNKASSKLLDTDCLSDEQMKKIVAMNLQSTAHFYQNVITMRLTMVGVFIEQSFTFKCIIVYFTAYYVLGAVLHARFLPWT